MRARILIAIGLLFFNTATHAYQVEAENLPSEKYFETALKEITAAKSSVFLVMYLISLSPTQPNSEPNQLVNALIKAKERGINVNVILDQNINFEAQTSESALTSNKHQQAYELLRKNNVPVFFDTSEVYTHAKAIIIDNETVIMGSTNWSKAALSRNNEVSALIRSKEFAQTLQTELNKIALQENIPASLTPSVPIPKDFLTQKNLLGEMSIHSDERSFDTYLYLLKEFNGNKENTITLDYDNLSKSLGIDKMSREDYRRQINKVLDKLKDKYNLIKFESPKRNQDTVVHLLKSPSEETLNLPTTYWHYTWNN